MITARFLGHILNTLKKWLSQLACRSASSVSFFLSLLRRFVLGHLKLGARGRRFAGALPRSQGNIARENAPICPNLLPPDQMGVPSPSDDPYPRIYSRYSQRIRKGTTMPLSQTNTTTPNGSTAEIDGLHQGSTSSFHPSLQTRESSVSNGMFPDDPLQPGSSSPGPSRPSGLRELSGSHSRLQIYTNDALSRVVATRAPSTRQLAPDMTHSRRSLLSAGSGRSLPRSIAGSQCGQAVYRPHKGRVYHLPPSIHSSIADLPNGLSDPGIIHNTHYTVPPGSDEQPGSEIVEVHQDERPGIFPMVAEDVMRYKRCIPRVTNSNQTTVPAMTIMFPEHNSKENVPLGWTTLVHPEGSRYFLNKEKRTFTEMNIFDEQTHRRIEYYMQYLLRGLKLIVKQKKLELDMMQVDLVLELKDSDESDGSVVCWYYFINHRGRCLFWLVKSDVKDILDDCKGVESLSHIRGWIIVLSRSGFDLVLFLIARACHPGTILVCSRKGSYAISQDHVNDVKDMLIHATCDHITSKRSSALGDVIELKDYISVVDGIKVYSPEDQNLRRCHAAIVIGRIMKLFSENQFINFHGENCVRLISDETVHGWEYTPSLLMVVVAPLLFLDPVTQVQELHRIFVDEIASTARWNALSSKLKGQLQDSNLLATVLLNVNVGFLAINTVDRGGRSAIQMASYLSLVTSLGSIILGVFLVWHERTSGDNTAFEAASFALRLHDEKHGLEKLAIIYSVPKALLMWGMVFFFVAFSIDWCGAGDTTSRAVVGTVILIVFVMISNGIIRIREGERWWWRAIGQQLSSLPVRAWKRIIGFVEMKRGQRCEPQPDPEDTSLHAGLSQANVEVDASMRRLSRSTISHDFQPEIPGPNGHEDHPHSSIPPTRTYQPTAFAASPLKTQGGNSTLLPTDSRTSPGFQPGVGSLQQIQFEDYIQTVSQDRSTPEAHCESDAIPLGHFTAPSCSTAKGIVETAVKTKDLHSYALSTTAAILSKNEGQTSLEANDAGAAISPSSHYTERMESARYTDNIVEEPEELDYPRPSSSTMPPPKIVARSATNEPFRHAPVAAKWTLQGGNDIEECKD